MQALDASVGSIQEIKLDEAVLQFLQRRGYEEHPCFELRAETHDDFQFVKVAHVAYERGREKSDLALLEFQQLLAAHASRFGKFAYLLKSDEDGVTLYLGSTNQSFTQSTFCGIYGGSKIQIEEGAPPHEMTHTKAMLGIPSLKRDSDKSFTQSLEKILSPMHGKRFEILIVAESYPMEVLHEIIKNLQDIGSEIHRLSKLSVNRQKSHGISEGLTITDTTGSSEGRSDSETESENESQSFIGGAAATAAAGAAVGAIVASVIPLAGTIIGATVGASAGQLVGSLFGGKLSKTEGTSKSTTKTTTSTTTTSKSTAHSSNQTDTDTFGVTLEEIDKSAAYCEELIDHYIKRFQKGLNGGMWNSTLYLQANDEVVLEELEHTLRSVYSGKDSHYEPLRFTPALEKTVTPGQLPMLYFSKASEHPVHPSFAGFGTAINTEELSLLAALPREDVPGISVSSLSVFGLNQTIRSRDSIDLGQILYRKRATSERFRLSPNAINSHIFVSGITGSGKSNTIKLMLKKMWERYKIPFLVIEPAKSEYKELLGDIDELLYFKPGSKGDLFKLNPFVFEPKDGTGVTLTKHVDMIKTAFNAAFPMYGPMPYVLEDAIHRIYADKGWSFETQENPAYVDSKEANLDRRLLLFPNMDDLKRKIEQVVDEAGYYSDLQNNIKAALKTRISNLTLGAKGTIFNSRHAIGGDLLFNKPVVIELSEITDDDEKAFLMGLLLNRLYSFLEERGASGELRHMTVIEEAHRLLPNLPLQTNMEIADPRGKAVETFTNILSEVRAYGEGIVIADQIPSKLHLDVIKNTNVKIIHRTMARDDRELLGGAINLDDDQILDIAELDTGEAIIHSKEVHQAFMVKVDPCNVVSSCTEAMVEDSRTRFAQKHPEIRYELPNESLFFVKNHLAHLPKGVTPDEFRYGLLRFVNVVMTAHPEAAFSQWRELAGNVETEEKRLLVYLSMKAWMEFGYLGNYDYYRGVDAFKSTLIKLSELIFSLAHDQKEEALECMESFRHCFEHRYLKAVFPSMESCPKQEIDHTLLILENMTTFKCAWEHANDHLSDAKQTPYAAQRLDAALQAIFGATSKPLRRAMLSIRMGDEYLDTEKLISRGGL